MFKTDTAAQPAASPSAVTRRGLFTLAGASAALAATPLVARSFGTGFTHGVASGEPGIDRILLWTRYVGEQSADLSWQVSEDEGFAQVVTEGSVSAGADRDWCAKGIAAGLQPGRWYFYRFIAPDGTASPVGRTRTLPEAGVQKFRLAVFSCSNFGFGWFNAYGHAAEANDADLAVHLGDYIYEYGAGTYPDTGQGNGARVLAPETEIVTLTDYRLRYATYRADPDLQRLHQVLPMIAVWDDHESANDSWKDGAQNHQPETEGDWATRKAIAKRVYREWMPVSDEPYAAYQVGDLATLFRLDTRLEGRDEQLDLGKVLAAQTDPDFRLVALIGDTMPFRWRKRLKELMEKYPFLEVCTLEAAGPLNSTRRAYRRAWDGSATYITGFRIDDDDAVAIDYIEKTRAIADQLLSLGWADADTPAAICFHRGIYWDMARPEEDQFWDYSEKEPLGLASAMITTPEGMTNIYRWNHRKLASQARCWIDPTDYMFVRTLHGYNDSDRSIPPDARAIPAWQARKQFRDRFGLSPRKLLPLMQQLMEEET